MSCSSELSERQAVVCVTARVRNAGVSARLVGIA